MIEMNKVYNTLERCAISNALKRAGGEVKKQGRLRLIDLDMFDIIINSINEKYQRTKDTNFKTNAKVFMNYKKRLKEYLNVKEGSEN